MTSLFLCCGKFDSNHHFILEAEAEQNLKQRWVFLVNCSDALSSLGSVVRPRATDSAVDISIDTYKMI